ncbi:hypothetical protein BJH93_10555 [Kocuria polaris]|nr:hypothetical protein [Kocuria polaris]
MHAVLVLRGGVLPSRVDDLALRMFGRWQHGIGKLGFDAVAVTSTGARPGVDVRISMAAEHRLAAYLQKSSDLPADVEGSLGAAGRSMAREASLGSSKVGRGGGRAPFQILADVRDVSSPDFAVWDEFVRASAGRRQLTWGGDLRLLAGLAAEARSDEEVVEEEFGSADDTVLIIGSDGWSKISKFSHLVLDAAETSDVYLMATLDDNAVSWFLPDQNATRASLTLAA